MFPLSVVLLCYFGFAYFYCYCYCYTDDRKKKKRANASVFFDLKKQTVKSV